MDFGIFYEIQVNSPLKHREREAEVFHQVLDQAVAAEEAGFNNFWSVEHHFQPGFSHSSAPEVLLRRAEPADLKDSYRPRGGVATISL
jgi:hypothetical protein